MKAVIMAGGKGTRLRPLTCDCPKPMVPIMNKPVMEHIIELLKRHQIRDIAVTTFYLPQVIEDYFGDGSELGVNLHYYIEDSPLGTAGSVKNAEEFLDEPFIVISGDALTDADLTKAINYHQNKSSVATLVLTQEDIPLEYGVVMISAEGEIIQFLEKPSWGEVFSDTVNTGIYILDPHIFSYYEKGIKFDFSQDLFPQLLAANEPMYGYVTDKYWCDIGNLHQYRQTHYDIIAGKVEVDIPGKQIQNQVWVGEGTEMSNDVELTGPLYIGENCKIKNGVHLQESIIGDNNIIKDNTSIKKSIIWNNSFIDQKSELRGTVTCDNVNLKDHVSLFEGTAIGDGTTIGKKAKVKPNVKVWPYKELADSTILNKSLVWETEWSRTLFGNQGVVGISNIEVTPEFAAKLGTAYGAMLDDETIITVSSDTYDMSKMLKQAVATGLMSAGIRVWDIGEMPNPVARYSDRILEAEGGIHVRACQKDPQNTVIEFLNEYGVNISRDEEKGIEKVFFREDFQRADLDAVGEVDIIPQMVDLYLDRLYNIVNTNLIKGQEYRIVADYDQDNLDDILTPLASKINCSLVKTNYESERSRPLSFNERLQKQDLILNMFEDENIALGFILDHSGGEVTLVTDRGELISQEFNEVIRSVIDLENGAKKIFIPITAPGIIEDIAKEYGAEVTWTKAQDKELLMKMLEYDLSNGKNIDSLPIVGDGLLFLVKVLEFLAKEEVKLSELIDAIPEFHRTKEAIECPWEDKGKVMRSLIEQTPEENIELIDGVKVYHDDGWTLILPDSEDPIFHVYTEADTIKRATALNDEYTSMINEIQLQ
ncbi:sugar phosphate nucleotidyltransferase [Selenihalanaerobacter shriftii]|uniref:Mannose-1-phosphate guanylyltransferase / phosphomannomutase n=1 Tax=Selenihalanaerobacter shriftii TaxID=142842 RepID=A0A1T4KHK8_9FIRM|nr:sugar phosphate nucleotidyltransferase [Selenihalanaerobacter shriftii]SJZ41918.1 mannose-1-phosphate guanylyltransferase / phosphomannomutase [Selenihalanaerobacter shriftii]